MHGPRASRLGHKSMEKKSVRNLQYGPKTRQIRDIFSLSPLDVISTVVTHFLSPAIGNDSNWALCWQASTHGWAASTFHSRCDGKNHTITVIRKDQYVFGGYTDIPWCKWLFRRGGAIKGTVSAKINKIHKETKLGWLRPYLTYNKTSNHQF